MAESKWKKIGSIRKGEKGDLYIKIDDTVSLLKGSTVQIQDPRKRIATAKENGKLSEEVADEMLSKIPDFIRYEIILPPPKR